MRSKVLLIALFSLIFLKVSAQYDTDRLSKEFHKLRREALRKEMPSNSVAIFFSAPEHTRSNDTKYLYHQDPDFYYLSGFIQSDALLLVFKNEVEIKGVTSNEFIFVPSKEPKKEMWTGKRLGVEGAKTALGFKGAFVTSELEGMDLQFNKLSEVLCGIIPKGIEDDPAEKFDLSDLVELISKPEYKINYNQIPKIMASLRQQKQAEELVLMTKAIGITCKGIKEMMKTVEPGQHEFNAQAVAEFMFTSNGSEYPGYASILGAGENSCTLHYETNRKLLEKQDLLVADVGAEYHGYSADVTRTIPVSGVFSEEQKLIYNIVLEAQEAGIKACKPGNSFFDPMKAADEVVSKGLIKLGLIKSESEFRKYLPHGVSHYLGLDVHDAGTYGQLQKGDVLTVEPGIYIPAGSDCDKKWWNIGVRIEDDVLITDSGNTVLSADAPKTVTEIEAVMKEKSVLNDLIK